MARKAKGAKEVPAQHHLVDKVVCDGTNQKGGTGHDGRGC